jgi:archaea-specific DNA-binding protein
MENPGIEETEEIAEESEEIAEEVEVAREMAGPEGASAIARTPGMPEAPRRDGNTVYVGKKTTMGYVLAVVTQFNNGAEEVCIKARGKLISRAVDVAEIVRHRFMPNSKVKDIIISTEELMSEDGSKNKVSSIEIKIQK